MRLCALATCLYSALSTEQETVEEYIVLPTGEYFPDESERDVVSPADAVYALKWALRLGVAASMKAAASTLLSASNVVVAAGEAVHTTARAYEVEQEFGSIVKVPSMVLEVPAAGLRVLAHGLEVTGDIVADCTLCQHTEVARFRIMTVGRPGAFVTALHNRIAQRRRNGASTNILEQELHDYIS